MRFYRLTTETLWRKTIECGKIEMTPSIDDPDKNLGVFVSASLEANIERWHGWVAQTKLKDYYSPESLVCMEIDIPDRELENLYPDPVSNELMHLSFKDFQEHDIEEPYVGAYLDWVYMTEIPIDWIKRIHWVKRFMRNVQTNQTVPYPDAGIWDSCTGWKSGARITKSKGLNTHNAIRIRLGNVSGAPLRRQPLSGLRAHPIGERTMRTKGICNHDVSSPTSSLGDVYGFTMNNEIDDQFIETGRTSVFNGYRACHSCGSVFHMGRKMLDKYGAIAELDGRPIDAKGVWKIWAVWTSEATERNRRWIA